jgi:hypothetical protein
MDEHNDQSFKDQSIGIVFRTSRGCLEGQGPRQVINQFDQADKNAAFTYHVSASMSFG